MINPSYEDIQNQARRPGVEIWQRADKARADLSEFYRKLQDDPRISDLARSERAWERYEALKAQVEEMNAKELSERSARTAERQSLPMPEGESVITTDKDKLLLTQGEHSRINHRIDRASSRATKATPFDLSKLLKEEFARGHELGGMQGGATCRAVVEIAQDTGQDIHHIVDEYRKPYQRQALEDAQESYMRQRLISKSLSKPPFPHPEKPQQGSKGIGTYRNAPALIPTDRGALAKKFGSNRRPLWK